MKNYWWCLLILLVLFPSFGWEFAVLLSIFAIPLALIIVFVANAIDIKRTIHDRDKKEK